MEETEERKIQKRLQENWCNLQSTNVMTDEDLIRKVRRLAWNDCYRTYDMYLGMPRPVVPNLFWRDMSVEECLDIASYNKTIDIEFDSDWDGLANRL